MPRRDQKTDDENRGDPVNATGGESKSPTHGQANEFLEDDNNAHRSFLPLEPFRHPNE